MGTRAVYTFKSHGESFHVYKHWDNQPICASGFISAACLKAWDLPRFEADEFAAGFIAANKDKAGDIRLVKSPNDIGDADYFYTVEFDVSRKFCSHDCLLITCRDHDRKQKFKGSFQSFGTWALAYAEAY